MIVFFIATGSIGNGKLIVETNKTIIDTDKRLYVKTVLTLTTSTAQIHDTETRVID